jgi:hypothetical protein
MNHKNLENSDVIPDQDVIASEINIKSTGVGEDGRQ